jgi:hypothetical protein
MVLKANDELRHEWDEDPHWRESWYWNFSDPENQIGCWIYLWVVPNKPLKSGMLVCLYHGFAADRNSTEAAWESPGHLLKGDDGSWTYCYREDVEPLFTEDVDDVELCGLSVKVIEPNKHHKLSFRDGDNASFDFDCEYMSRPWDFADNVHPTPRWLAKDRYHRGWKAKGSLTIAGKTYRIDTTGDSDHSWGTRDMGIFEENNLKTYAIQSKDGALSVKAQMLGEPGRELPRGYIAHGEEMWAVKTIEESSRYLENGRMHDISLRVTDVAGHVVEAHMDAMYAAVAGGGPNIGFEGAGVWEVKDWGRCAGLASCWWSNDVTAKQLHEGEAGKTEASAD